MAIVKNHQPIFTDRSDAGRDLARKLRIYQPERGIVLGLPRGGVVTALEIAKSLGWPMDALVVRKIGHPDNPEFAVGALAEDDAPLLGGGLNGIGLTPGQLEDLLAKEKKELSRRVKIYRSGRKLNVAGKTVIAADDGLATGLTALAAIRYLKKAGAKKIVLAAPVAPPEAVRQLTATGADLTILYQPFDFQAVGQYYLHFDQVTDAEVQAALRSSQNPANPLQYPGSK